MNRGKTGVRVDQAMSIAAIKAVFGLEYGRTIEDDVLGKAVDKVLLFLRKQEDPAEVFWCHIPLGTADVVIDLADVPAPNWNEPTQVEGDKTLPSVSAEEVVAPPAANAEPSATAHLPID